MNELRLKEFNDERIVYLYQPEGRGECGEIVYFFSEAKAKIMKRAEEESDWYAYKAVFKIEECVQKNNLPIKFIQAWY